MKLITLKLQQYFSHPLVGKHALSPSKGWYRILSLRNTQKNQFSGLYKTSETFYLAIVIVLLLWRMPGHLRGVCCFSALLSCSGV